MAGDDLPNILKPRARRGESRWQRFWRRRRMNALRNSSQHAAQMAVGLLVLILGLAIALILIVRNAQLPSGVQQKSPGVPKPLN